MNDKLVKINAYSMTKANMPVRAELADIHSMIKEAIISHNSGWISVDDELPKQNGFYLVCYDREFNDGFYLKKIDVVDFCKPINRFSFYHDFITHWQYLPQPPKE